MEQIFTSKRFNLKLRDFLKGAIIAIGTPVLDFIQRSIDMGTWQVDWQRAGMIAVSGFLVYIIKNFFDKPKVIITASSNVQADYLKEKLE